MAPTNERNRSTKEINKQILSANQKWKRNESNHSKNNEELRTFLAIESETQKDILKDEAFEEDDIALDNDFIQHK